MAEYELNGVAVVAVGSFNPAIFHPRWLSENELLAANEAEHALEAVVLSPQLTTFTADWLNLQVTTEQAIFSTIEEAHELELRDLARGTLDLLPHTPVDALGLNADSHFRVDSEAEWHAVGDQFLPKDFWEPLFEGEEWIRRDGGEATGLRGLKVEAWRTNKRDYVRIEVAPSARLKPWGVYVGINAHYQLTEGDDRGTGHRAAQAILENWDAIRDFEHQIQQVLLRGV